MDPVNGLGLTKQPRTIQTFKPFFVSLDLPYSVKRGEVLTVSIVVFNYLNRDLDTDVTIHNEEQDFDFVEMNNEVGDNPSKWNETCNQCHHYYHYSLLSLKLSQKSSSIGASGFL